jgi:hypothetical protein
MQPATNASDYTKPRAGTGPSTSSTPTCCSPSSSCTTTNTPDQPGPTYAEWREGHLDAERELRVSGVRYADHKPQAPKINPEVLYSLRCQENPRADGH